MRLSKIKPEEVKKLVFNGGGAKGLGHVTAYAATLACGVKPEQVQEVAGTSAGSIMAAVVAVGYNVDEILSIMKEMDFKKFFDEHGKNTAGPLLKTVGKLEKEKSPAIAVMPALSKAPVMFSRIGKEGGIYMGEELRTWIERVINKKTDTAFCTFSELHELTQRNPLFSDLTVVAVNKQSKMTPIRVFNYKNSPNVIISDAIRASTAIPLVFEPHQIHEKINGLRVQESDDLYVDGGINQNYPITVFDLPDEAYDRSVLGFKITSKEEAEFLRGDVQEPPREAAKTGLFNMVKTTVSAATQTEKSQFLNRPQDMIRTIAIDNRGVSTIAFNLIENPRKFNELTESGWNAPCQYFGMKIEFPEKFTISEEALVLSN